MHVVNTLDEGRAILSARQLFAKREAGSASPLEGEATRLSDPLGALSRSGEGVSSLVATHHDPSPLATLDPLPQGERVPPASRSESIIALFSPPFAACYAGVNYYRHLVDPLKAEFADVPFTFTIDCGDDAAVAFEALRVGFTHVRCGCNEAQFAELEKFSKSIGAVLKRTSA